MRNLIVVLVVSLAVVFVNPAIFAQEEHQHGLEGGRQVETAGEEEPIEVGNKICPVSGEEIKEEEALKYEYEGKIYNLCCKMCLKDFKKDPKKYIERLETIKDAEEEKHEHGSRHREEQHSHGEHHEHE